MNKDNLHAEPGNLRLKETGSHPWQQAPETKRRLGQGSRGTSWPPGSVGPLVSGTPHHKDSVLTILIKNILMECKGHHITASAAWKASQMGWSGFQAPQDVRGHMKCLLSLCVSLMVFWPGQESRCLRAAVLALAPPLSDPLGRIGSLYHNKCQ